jgi:hypothetical protein
MTSIVIPRAEHPISRKDFNSSIEFKEIDTKRNDPQETKDEEIFQRGCSSLWHRGSGKGAEDPTFSGTISHRSTRKVWNRTQSHPIYYHGGQKNW